MVGRRFTSVGAAWSRRLVALGAVFALVGSACSAPASDGDTVTVVVTTSIWADVVANVVGDAVEIATLVPTGTDPHEFQPSAQQVAALMRADLVVANGLGLEAGLDDVLDAARDEGVHVLELGPLVDPLPLDADADDGTTDCVVDPSARHDDPGGCDPHVWMDPMRAAGAAREVATALTELFPGADWTTAADEYALQLAQTDAEIAETLDSVPAASRKLVTNHDALGYFAKRYGFEVVGTVIPGASTLSDPSSAELASLVGTMRAEGVDVIFSETTEASTLANALAEELGSSVAVVTLYTGSLGEQGSGADTLATMLATDAHLIADALGS